MGINTSVEEIMKSEAEYGLFHLSHKIGRNKANELREQGLDVTDLKEVNFYPRIHYISWRKILIECLDVNLLDENSDKYTLAQKLWIIAMKNQPNSKKATKEQI